MFFTSSKSANKNLFLMNLCKVQISLISVLLFQIALLHLNFVNGYGEFCFDKFDACKENEMCVVFPANATGVCTCLSGYREVLQNKTCVASSDSPPVVPSSGHTALTIALVLLFTFVSLVGTIGFLYYRYGFFSGVIHSLYRFRRRAPSEQAYQITDDGDDINPIV